jgi:hypothetical protein
MTIDWQKVATVLSLALSTIDKIISSARERRQNSGLDAAADALTAIGAIVDAVKGGAVSEADLAKAQDDLEHLVKAIGSTDRRIDELIAERFGPKPATEQK